MMDEIRAHGEIEILDPLAPARHPIEDMPGRSDPCIDVRTPQTLMIKIGPIPHGYRLIPKSPCYHRKPAAKKIRHSVTWILTQIVALYRADRHPAPQYR